MLVKSKPLPGDGNLSEKTFESLLAAPHMGTLYQAKRPRLIGIRFFPVSKFQNYVIYYREHPQGMEIVRFLHARRDKKEHLEPEE